MCGYDYSCSSIPQSSTLFAPEQSDVESCSDSNNELKSLKDVGAYFIGFYNSILILVWS